MATDLTSEALAGFNSTQTDKNPHLWSSAAWLGFEAGKAHRRKGYTLPTKAAMSRGYSVKIKTNMSLFLVEFGDKLETKNVRRLD